MISYVWFQNPNKALKTKTYPIRQQNLTRSGMRLFLGFIYPT